MKRWAGFVVLGLVLTGLKLPAQQPGSGVEEARSGQMPAASPVTFLATSTPPGPAPAPADAACRPPTCKVCVSEPKHTTKTVYACKREEYCLPRCSFLSLFWGKCDCDDGRCGEVKVRHRLVVKKVEGCDTKQCTLREVPLDCVPAPCGKPVR